jgi:hypothetical protein
VFVTTLSLFRVSSAERLADVRYRLRVWLAGAFDAESVYRVQLVTTELLSYALVHGGGAGVPRAELRSGVVRIEVRDDVLDETQLLESAAAADLGLRIVAATSHRWGVDVRDDGKVLWSEVIVGRQGASDGEGR